MQIGLKKSKGFTLLESLIVALVIGALIAASLRFKSFLDTQSAINTLSSGLQVLSEKARDTFGTDSLYGVGNLNFVVAKNKGFVDPRYKVVIAGNNATVTNQYNGAVVLTGFNTYFTYSEVGLPDEVCSSVVTKLSKTWATVKVGAAADRTVPVDPNTAAIDCSNTSNTILLTSKA